MDARSDEILSSRIKKRLARILAATALSLRKISFATSLFLPDPMIFEPSMAKPP